MSAAVDAGDRSWAWHLDRAAAIALVVVLPLHLAAMLTVRTSGEVTAATALARWDEPLWRVLDLALVGLGLIHGTSSLRRVLGTARSGLVRRIGAVVPWGASLLGLVAAAALLGTVS
jgi:succinate dehydrogenase hydrophobic anchor subunit